MNERTSILLQSASDTAKHLVGMKRVDEPKWTLAWETVLAKLPNKDVEQVIYLLEVLKAKSQSILPKEQSNV